MNININVKRDNTITSSRRSCLALTILLLISIIITRYLPAEASEVEVIDTSVSLIEEIQEIAISDVNSDIPRRTGFILSLYSNNSEGLSPIEIMKSYDDSYSERQEEIERKNHKSRNIIISFGIILTSFVFFLFYRAFQNRKFKLAKIIINLPFDFGEIEVETIESSRNAAWQLYIELMTRIATQPLKDDSGVLREAMNSLYSMFSLTRQILKDAGPDVGIDPDKTVGSIAISVLNDEIRPVLSKWHPKLQEWEAQCPEGISVKEHERNWEQEGEMRNELHSLTIKLKAYSIELAKIANVK